MTYKDKGSYESSPPCIERCMQRCMKNLLRKTWGSYIYVYGFKYIDVCIERYRRCSAKLQGSCVCVCKDVYV